MVKGQFVKDLDPTGVQTITSHVKFAITNQSHT